MVTLSNESRALAVHQSTKEAWGSLKKGGEVNLHKTSGLCVEYIKSLVRWIMEGVIGGVKKRTVVAYAISIAIALGVGGLSALLTMGNMSLYEEVRQPPFAPPAILFPIVWTVLYVLMGISAAMIYTDERAPQLERSSALMPYGASLFVNFLWPILFFNFRAFLPAFIWLILLEFLIVMTIISYRRINTGAAYLQIPYAIWVAFAGYLNLAIWMLNR